MFDINSKNFIQAAGLSACRFLLTIAVIPLLLSCGGAGDTYAKKGVLDLRNINLGGNPLYLNGEWEFYWNRFIMTESLHAVDTENSKRYIYVPGTWSRSDTSGAGLPREGFATYRLKILAGSDHKRLAIRMTTASTACRFFINGQEVYSAGIPGETPELSEPAYRPGVFVFQNPGGVIDLVIHVSNFHYRDGGLWRPLTIGLQDDIAEIKETRDYLALAVFGAMLIMALYHLGLFSLRKKDIFFLYFSILCMFVALRTLSTGEYLITHFFPSIGFKQVILCEYLSLFIGTSVFTLYMRSLFRSETSRRVTIAVAALGGIYSLAAIILPVSLFTRMIHSFEGAAFFYFLYVIYVVTKSMIKGRRGAALFLSGLVIILFALLNDMLHSNFVIQTMNLSNLSIFVFVCIHSFILSLIYTHSFNMVEKLSLDLKQLNNSLEMKVNERTGELQSAYESIKELTVTDPLTKCYNRRYLNENLLKEIARSVRYNQPLSVIICDIDRFKNINDTFGHMAGDNILKTLPERISGNIRTNIDWIVRFGGEEFIIVLPSTDLDGARIIAERIRTSVESTPVKYSSYIITFTASFGVASLAPVDYSCTADDLITRADTMLYEAKRGGRNRVAW